MLHRSPRALLLWAAAAVVAVGTGAVVAADLAALHRRAHELGPELHAVVARHDLAMGVTVTPDDLSTRAVHRSQLPAGVLTSTAGALGRVIVTPVLRGGYVTDRNLAPRRRTGTDGALPAGTRAFRLVVDDALRPRPGAAVDVLATDGRAGADAIGDGSAPASSARVVAGGVLVLATDDAGRSAGGGPALGVTLLVTPRQARDLAAAAATGTVALALDPPEDARVPAPS
ncbi:MAG TPA: Flp pilus assembly protein CpaB [Acidimicrobiia bacterium]|nr:Flp pilus assembly protein CpaB [Acidimicrobiia bacterium]